MIPGFSKLALLRRGHRQEVDKKEKGQQSLALSLSGLPTQVKLSSRSEVFTLSVKTCSRHMSRCWDRTADKSSTREVDVTLAHRLRTYPTTVKT